MLSILRTIETISNNSKINIDLTNSTFIDHTSIERLHDLKRERSIFGGDIIIKGHDKHEPYSSHVLAARRLKT